MQKVGPCLWFDGQAEEAAAFYVSVFRNSSIITTTHYLEGMHRSAGSVLTVQFILEGETFVALNGGPDFAFSPAVSFIVTCDTQEEIDHYWQTLSGGGQEYPCGWLQDKFGVSWQIVPKVLMDMIGSEDSAAAQRVMQAMLEMKKLDISILQRAYL